MAFDLTSARPVEAPRPAAPRPAAQPRDLRPAGRVRAEDVSTAATQTSAARTAQTIGQSAQTFPLDLAILRSQAEKAQLELDDLREKQKNVKNGEKLDLKEQQAMAAARATLMAYGEMLYRDAKNRGYNPSSLRSKFSSALEAVPIAGRALSSQVLDPVSSQARAGRQQFTEGALRTVTGAGGPASERPETAQQYFPTPWDVYDAKTLRGLDQLRLAQLTGSARIAGPAIAPQTSALINTLSAPSKPRGAAAPKALPRVKNDAEYAALPSGTTFLDPQGNKRTKP